LLDLFDLSIAAWPAVNGIGESNDHHVGQMSARPP
jgi:hypothetical protein